MFWRLLIFSAALAALCALLIAGAALAGGTLPRAEVMYMSYQHINPDLYVMDMRSGLALNLTRQDAYDATPAWSPDGSMVAFMSDRDGRPGIFLMDFSGRDVRRLTPEDGVYTNPLWSADGERVVFTALHEGADVIYAINVDGTNMEHIAGGDLPPVGVVIDLGIEPGGLSRVYSPDGTQIAFLAHRDGSWGIWLSDNDRRHERLLTLIGREYSDTPVWSPDGHQLAFVSHHEGTSDLYIISVDGDHGLRRLTFDRAVDAAPVWRPTG